jgi:hypothetical protein
MNIADFISTEYNGKFYHGEVVKVVDTANLGILFTISLGDNKYRSLYLNHCVNLSILETSTL